MQVIPIHAAIQSNVPVSIMQSLSRVDVEETNVLFNVEGPSASDGRSIRRADSKTVSGIDDLREVRNAFLAAIKSGESVQSQSLLDPIL